LAAAAAATCIAPGMSRRTITLQLGFGLGHAFLEAWHDWRSGAALGAPPARLDFIAIASPLPEADALRRAHHGSALQPLADALAAQWPRSGRNLHRLGFDAGRVQLLLALATRCSGCRNCVPRSTAS
jgi:tRNA 5-methylaminomethyl-2-thiouridine biosynthesis bifunctional protein